LRAKRSNPGFLKHLTGLLRFARNDVASAPVGSGSGLMFTELYSAGAEHIVRYGSDDVKNPTKEESNLVDPYEGYNKQQALNMEMMFADYILSALSRIR